MIYAIILLLLLVLYGKYKEGFDLNSNVIVVSRYNEKLDWLKDEPFNKYSVIIYNKGNDEF